MNAGTPLEIALRLAHMPDGALRNVEVQLPSTDRSAMGNTRQLLTIFAADVAEYSRMIELDETATLASLVALRARIDGVFERYNGRVANTAGDSVLAVFQSPTDAVAAALEIQKTPAGGNIRGDSRQLKLRIGIHIGDVEVQRNGDILGHGVNIAARLEQIAPPGGVCLSESVMEHVSKRFDLSFKKLGEHYLKNIDGPIRVYTTDGAAFSGAPALARFLKRLNRNPLLQIFVIACSVVALTVGVVALSKRNILDSSAVDSLVADAPTPKELLKRFDLVTTGHYN